MVAVAADRELTATADALLAWAIPHARVISACTPINLEAELTALHDDFGRGHERAPRFLYAARPEVDVRDVLLRAAEELDSWDDGLASLYAARARELSVEAAICHAAGRRQLPALAAKRYPNADSPAGWLERPEREEAPTVISDDRRDRRSLLNRLGEELGARRLPVRVVVSDRLSALAATGPGVIYVAAGRAMTERDVERTVLHEIEGHALPRERSRGLLRHGTAQGSDHQEGRALVIEERAGFLDRGRRYELACRHLAGQQVRAGSDFVQTVRVLRDSDAELGAALRIAARAHRGGGLARELVYLPAYLHVKGALERDPSIEAVMETGQCSVEAAAILTRYI